MVLVLLTSLNCYVLGWQRETETETETDRNRETETDSRRLQERNSQIPKESSVWDQKER